MAPLAAYPPSVTEAARHEPAATEARRERGGDTRMPFLSAPPAYLNPGRPSNMKGGDSGASCVTKTTPGRTSALQIAQNRHKVCLDERRSSGGFEIAFARGSVRSSEGMPSHGLRDPHVGGQRIPHDEHRAARVDLSPRARRSAARVPQSSGSTGDIALRAAIMVPVPASIPRSVG